MRFREFIARKWGQTLLRMLRKYMGQTQKGKAGNRAMERKL